MSFYPNFIIGVTANSDTIGIIDKDFNGTINKNDKISVSPAIWSEEDKELIKPLFTVFKKTKENNLCCSVKIIYYGSCNKK